MEFHTQMAMGTTNEIPHTDSIMMLVVLSLHRWPKERRICFSAEGKIVVCAWQDHKRANLSHFHSCQYKSYLVSKLRGKMRDHPKATEIAMVTCGMCNYIMWLVKG